MEDYRVGDKVIVILDKEPYKTFRALDKNLPDTLLLSGRLASTFIKTEKVNDVVRTTWRGNIKYDSFGLSLNKNIFLNNIVGRAISVDCSDPIKPELLINYIDGDDEYKKEVLERYNKLSDKLDKQIEIRRRLLELNENLNIKTLFNEVNAKKIVGLFLKRIFKDEITLQNYVDFLNNHFDFINYLQFLNTDENANWELSDLDKVIARNFLSDMEFLCSIDNTVLKEGLELRLLIKKTWNLDEESEYDETEENDGEDY